MTNIQRKHSCGAAGIVAWALIASTANTAAADESAYCRQVRERAAEDSALLIAPTLRAEALKLPTAIQPKGRVDPLSAGASYQMRAGVSLSAINIYKGIRLGDVADADCAAHDAQIAAQELLGLGLDAGRLGALRAEVVYLDSQRPVWEGISRKMEQRFEAKTEILLSLEDVRARTRTILRRRTEIMSEVQRLEAIQPTGPARSLARLTKEVTATAMRAERESSHVRSLEAWDINVTGGYVPPILDAPKSDFFGLVQFSYNLGGPFRNASASRHLSARAEELKSEKYLFEQRLVMFRQQLDRSREGAQKQLALVDGGLAQLKQDREAIEKSEAPSSFYTTAMLDLELIGLEAEHVFLTAWIRELTRVEES